MRTRLTELWNFENTARRIRREGPLLLFQERRPAESERGLHDDQPGRSADGAAGSERAVQRWHGGARRHVDQPRRQADGLRHRRGRIRLARVARARCRNRSGPARCPRIKFSGAAWTKDNKGFYYGRFDEPKGKEFESVNYFQKLYYHRLGTTQDKDTLVYESKEHKDWQFSPTVTDDGKYLIITVAKGTDDKYRIPVQDLSQPGASSSS